MSGRRSRGIPGWLTVLAIAAIVAGCSGAALPAPVGTAQSAREPAGTGGGGDKFSAAQRAPAGAPGGGGALDQTAPGPRDDAKIVKTGTLELQVKDLPAALADARAKVAALGGYIGASQQTNDGDRSTAVVTYRIPADRWDDALDALHGLAIKVVSEQTNAVEVTGQLIDLAARIDNLRASERALQAIAARATKISDVLEVQQQLTDVRGQIEQLTAEQAHLADQAALGTLTVTFGLQVVAITEATKKWNPASEFDRATAALVDVLQGVATAGIWVAIVWLPILLVLGLVVLAAVVIARRLGLRRRPVVTPPAAPPAVPAA